MKQVNSTYGTAHTHPNVCNTNIHSQYYTSKHKHRVIPQTNDSPVTGVSCFWQEDVGDDDEDRSDGTARCDTKHGGPEGMLLMLTEYYAHHGGLIAVKPESTLK